MRSCVPRSANSILAALTLAAISTCSARGQQPADVTLTVSFANGQTVFHVGETIPLELAFTASVENTYEMSTRRYDRSGRLNLEEFHVIPPGRDPLYNYYNGGLFGGFIGGGLSSGPRFLGSQAQIIHEDLNEWAVLDAPGQYSLYVTSGRVSHRVESQFRPVQVRSNTLNFEVIEAGPGWQEQTLASATKVLDGPNSTQDQKLSAFRTLRFLDSPGSIRELVRRLGEPGNTDSWNCVAGLIGSKHQQLVLQDLQASFAAPGTGITSDYILILAATQFLLNREAMPPHPLQNQQQQKQWQAEFQERLKSFAELRNHLYQQALAIANTKVGAAQAETVRTLLLQPYSSPSEMRPLAGLSPSLLASAFLLLPPDEQATLLQYSWARLNVPGMEGALESILDQPQIPHQRLRDLALRRLYELDPAEGAERIMAEIRQPHVDRGMFTVSGKTLGLLPDKTLPQFDELLANRLEEKDSRTKDLDAQLIGRYATKLILPRVKALHETAPEGTWGCAVDSGLVSYFLRVDPDYAMQRLKGPAGSCLSESYRAVVKMGRWSEIEPSIIRELDNPNLWIARAAAETLARYGGPKAKAAMWERLRKFHRQWAARQKELWNSPKMPPDVSDAIAFEFGLVEALGKAQAWVLDNDEIAELESLTLGQERENVAHWHWHSPLNLSLDFSFGGQLQADVNQVYFMNDVDSLRAKLAQFPSGTQFRVRTYGTQEELAPLIQAIEETAREHGLTLEVEQAN